MAKNEEKQAGGFQWFIFVILIPLVFTITLTLFISTLMGVNIFDKASQFASNIPVVSKMVDKKENKTADNPVDLKAEIKDKQVEIDNLNSQLKSKDNKIEDLNKQIKELQQKLNDKQQASADRTKLLSDISTSFKGMDAAKAAPIIENMDKDVALEILKGISGTLRGKIFAEMDPQKAAAFTSALLKTSDQ